MHVHSAAYKKMGAISSCCAVEDATDRQVMKEAPAAAAPAADRTRSAMKGKKEAAAAQKEVKEPADAAALQKEGKESKEDKKMKKQASTGPPPAVSKEEINDLRGRLQAGLNITVLLQDATKLSCTLHLNAADNSLSISCEDKVRVIPLSDVKSLLHTRDQLKRVETRANLVDDGNCVALHLLESGNCIPLRFEEAKDKSIFVEMMRQLKAE